MGSPIESYAMIGDTQSAALVGRDTSIDWLCWPRFDSDACFAALLGGARAGRWVFTPSSAVREHRRRYRPDTLVLETELVVDGGVLRVTDCMPRRAASPDLIRVVEAVEGSVEVRMELAARFGYGDRRPWVERVDGAVTMVSAPDAMILRSSAPVREHDATIVADLHLVPGRRHTFSLGWYPAHREPPPLDDPEQLLAETEASWRDWASRCSYRGEWRDAVVRSLITLKALTYGPTGAIVAAPTTSLPEWIGGVRNWDYRYCWLRDATLTLYALVDGGYLDEARTFGAWLERTARGEPSRLQTIYGVAGERRLTELELPWLAGYEGSAPVRIGNLASSQFQLDVYGELIDSLHHARQNGLEVSPGGWALQGAIVTHIEEIWREPDSGIWELRGPRRHLTHSKMMAWVAFDRMIKDAERLGLEGPVRRWREHRAAIHADVCAHAYDATAGAFTQSYGSPALDASVLLMPLVGFLPATDPRVRSTVDAIRRDLGTDGLVYRYHTRETDDGLPPQEGVFLPCSFWMADALHAIGDEAGARARFADLLSLRNDVGLLSEEVDPRSGRLLGNFPQAFSHVALVNTAMNLSDRAGPAERRPSE